MKHAPVLLAVLLNPLLLKPVAADTLTLRSGGIVHGKWLGADSGQILFQVSGQTVRYPRTDVAEVVFEPAIEGSTPAGPAAPQPQSIAVGQTIDQVVATLGKPRNIIDLGEKKIYVYADLKVTFVNGRMTAAE